MPNTSDADETTPPSPIAPDVLKAIEEYAAKVAAAGPRWDELSDEQQRLLRTAFACRPAAAGGRTPPHDQRVGAAGRNRGPVS